MKTSPFEYVRSINEKKYIDNTREYNPYLTNNSLSYSMDTIMICNELNYYHSLPSLCSYDFLFHSIRAGKRFNKWFKEEEVPHLAEIQEYFGFSKSRALESLQVLSQAQIREILEQKGGTQS